jgi:tRNA pseudouridine55 synthase
MFDFQAGEILLINKSYKWTSFDVVGKIRQVLKQQLGIKKIKVGHAGTLDPLATGLLIVCTGKYTKRIEEFQGMDKTYSGTFYLGATTPSYDMETAVDKTFEISHLTEKEIIGACKKFTGLQQQVPPLFSAVKIGGRRAYDFARNQQECKIEPREINIININITAIRLPEVDFMIVCSKGTYIRALARDLGNALGCGAYLNALRRDAIGTYKIEDAITPEQFEFLIAQQANK